MTPDNYSVTAFYNAGPMLAFLLIFHVFHGSWELWLLYTQIKGIMGNVTINELSNWPKYPEFQDGEGNFYNPYKKETWTNIKEFLTMKPIEQGTSV